MSLPPEEDAALAAFEVLSKWLPSSVGPSANLGLKIARQALEREQDPVAYLRTLLEADGQKLAAEKWG